MPETPFTPAELALERAGLGFLRDGKFRKARDAFKSLNKSQPARALPLLIDANLGLAGEMMSKGLVSEANQVLAYLKTIAPASCDLTPTSVAKETSRDAWSAMVPLAAQRLAGCTQPDAGIRAADEMILGATSPDHPGHPDAKAILTALEIGYGSAATARTAELLRSVPRSSPFSHWVFFFKGMTALEAADHARAADCLRRVPQNSLLHPSVSALLTICGAPAATPPAPRTVHALCAWAGQPKLAEPLLQAEPLWRKNQPSKAFTLLTKKIPDLIRWGARGFKADLTRFLTTRLVHSGADDTNYADTLVNYASGKSRTAASIALDQAFFCVGLDEYPECSHSHFSGSVVKLDRIFRVAPLSPAMLSRIFTKLAGNYIAAIKNDPGDLCSPPNAKKALEHAIKHDPENLRAWLMQCDLLSMGKDTPAYNRFLDDLTKRFPAQKEVLIRNGDCCVARKTYTKALRNFENAAKIDSVDPRITRGILRAHLGIAEKAYAKRTPAKVDWKLIESLASPGQSCAESSLWRVRVRRIVLDARHGVAPEESLVAMAAATLPLAPSAFLLETACRFGILEFNLTFKQETLGEMFPSRPAPESLADFLAVIDELEAFEDSPRHLDAKALATQIFSEHETRLLQFAAERKDLTALLIRVFSCSSPVLALASPVIEKFFALDPNDPALRYLCASYRFPWLPAYLNEHPSDLATLLHDSPDPDDRRLLMLFEKSRQRSAAGHGGKTPRLDLDYDPHDDEYDDDDEYPFGDDGDFEDELAAIDKTFGKMSPSQLRKALAEILGDSGIPNPYGPSPGKRPKP